MIPVFRVSHVAAFARWREDEESDVDWLINQIRAGEETELMRKGTAFHKALETVRDGFEGNEITSGDYRFIFTCDVELSLPRTRELRKGKDYGGIIISGQCDGIGGRCILDHKTTAKFDAENYLEGWQHKLYLDIFDGDRFDWYAWEMTETGEKTYEVFGFHKLTQYRYPALAEDCRKLVLDFKEFAQKYLPDFSYTGANIAPVVPEIKMFGTRGKNLIAVGWTGGILKCAFASKDGPRYYRYAGVPEAEFEKLKSNPFPDRLFTTNIKGKFTVLK